MCKKIIVSIIAILFLSTAWGAETWKNYTNSNNIDAIAVDEDCIWTANEFWLYKLDKTGQEISRYNASVTNNNLFGANLNQRILTDNSGRVWLSGGRQGGAWYFDGNNLVKSDVCPDTQVYDIAEDNSGSIWFATFSGAYKLDVSTITRYTNFNGLLSSNVRAVTVDKSGAVWFGCARGVSKLDGTNWQHIR